MAATSAVRDRPGARRALLWVGILVTALFTYLAVRQVELGEVWTALRTSNVLWLGPAFAVVALSMFIRAVRWQILFLPDRRPPLGPVADAMLVGVFFNNVLPLRAGEAARVVRLNQLAGTSRAETAGTVAVERAFDVLSLLVLLFVALPWLPEVGALRAAGILGAVLALVLAATILVFALYGERPLRLALRPLARLPFVSAERLDGVISNFGYGFAGLRDPRVGLAAFAWTTLSWIVMAFSFWLVTLGFDIDVPPLAGLLVLVTTGLGMIVPSAPAALGVFEYATIVALAAYGVAESEATAYALVLHALNVIPYIVAGLILLRRRRTPPRSV